MGKYDILVSHLRECSKLDKSENTFTEAANAIEELESRFERKKGKWEWYNCVWVCSCCGKNPTKGMGYVQSKKQLFPFCPYCGADMRGET